MSPTRTPISSSLLSLCLTALFIGSATEADAQDGLLVIQGDTFVQSNLGAMEIGFPNNGNRWRLSTSGGGANLLFRFKPDAINTFDKKFWLLDSGEFGIANTPTAWLHLHQEGQAVGRGLRFDDGVNLDWDITHGFGLRLCYGGVLRGTFSAATGAWIQSSDFRGKENMRVMPSVLSRVEQLYPLTYRYKNSASDQDTIGFVAQEVLPPFPELVSYSEVDDVYGIEYAGFSVVAIKAIQELQAQLKARDSRVADLERRLAAIEQYLQ